MACVIKAMRHARPEPLCFADCFKNCGYAAHSHAAMARNSTSTIQCELALLKLNTGACVCASIFVHLVAGVLQVFNT